MIRDEYLRIYMGVVALAAVAMAFVFHAERPRLDAASITLPGEAIGDIETASVPAPSGVADPAGGDARAWNAPAIPWTSVEEGLAQMAETGKPGLLVLHAEWCLECRSYRRLFAGEEVSSFADDFVFMLADIDREPELQQQFNFDGDYIPRTLVLDDKARPTELQTGAHPRQRYFVDPYESDELLSLLSRAR